MGGGGRGSNPVFATAEWGPRLVSSVNCHMRDYTGSQGAVFNSLWAVVWGPRVVSSAMYEGLYRLLGYH